MAELSASHLRLFKRSNEFYHTAFCEDGRARDYLFARGITDNSIFSAYKIGFANGTLRNVLPDEGDIIGRLKEIGILNAKGTEHFYGCVTFPLYDVDGNPAGLYGRRIGGHDNGGPDHLYLPGPRRGLFNRQAARAHKKIILTESIIDSLALIRAGIKNTIPCYGTNGLTPEHLDLFKKNGVETVYVCFDADDSGRKAMPGAVGRLRDMGIRAFPVMLPDGRDVNEFFSLTENPGKRFSELLLEADPDKSTLKEKKEIIVPARHGFTVTINGRKYEVIGISKGTTKLRATVKGIKEGKSKKPLFDVDTIDFYSARSRTGLVQRFCNLFAEDVETITADINRLLELTSGHDVKPEKHETKEEIPEDAKQAALAMLKNPEMFAEITADIEALGYTGEEMNKLLCYIAVISRKMDEPLSIIILSRSAAGKSCLQETILSMSPEEAYEKYTRLTDQALFYMGDKSLAHKVLAIEELAGANGAIYSIRSIQSSKQLSVAYVTKDPVTGEMITKKSIVEGPVSVFLTTTNADIDEETASRYIFLSIDESEEMTRRILAKQRKAHTMEGMRRKLGRKGLLLKHRAVDQLLEPYGVVNPYAELLTFTSKSLRVRRDHMKYLNLILAVAFLFQHQRKIKPIRLGSKVRNCVFVTIADISMANEIANDVLGRSLDELSPPCRTLLIIIREMVLARAAKKRIKPGEYRFTRRDIRKYSGWSDYQVKTYVRELEELEYIYSVSGKKGREYVYELLVTGQFSEDKPFMAGLIDIAELKQKAAQAGIVD